MSKPSKREQQQDKNNKNLDQFIHYLKQASDFRLKHSQQHRHRSRIPGYLRPFRR